MRKQLAILGSTGSIGRQALEVVKAHPELFSIEVLTAQNNRHLLIGQAIEFQPNAVVIGNEEGYGEVKDRLAGYPIKVFAGQDALSQIVEMEGIDMVLNSLVGFAGMMPTYNSVKNGKPVALANKESLVIAGDLIMNEARISGSAIIPVDSEHSAIFQCLAGEDPASIEKIYLTASGGPFRGQTQEMLKRVTRKDALRHPNWNMGNKITIDSATLMNKGLEVIEAHWLFNLRLEQIEVVVHPQSVIHSMVQFVDGSMKAQLGVPDMRLPILYALAFPQRLPADLPRLNFTDYPSLTFEPPDKEVFKSLSLAYQALEWGGNAPCILNAANEVAVEAFLQDELSFLGIPRLIEECLASLSYIKKPSLTDYIETHLHTIQKAKKIIVKPNVWKF
ncbi:MAG: 1-deoxy-D-xylulose-5-phosphate reductoisomerase [bacterium]